MLQDYPFVNLGITSLGSARPFWTLSIEWWLYLAFGWILLAKRNTRKEMILFLVVLAFLLMVPIANLKGRGNGLTIVWLMGGLIYIALVQFKDRNISKKVFLIASLSSLFFALSRAYLKMTEYDLVIAVSLSISMATAIFYTQASRYTINSFAKNIIKKASDFSFTLYLIHYTLFDFISHFDQADCNRYLLFFLTFLMSNICAYFIATCTEKKHKNIATYLKTKL